MIGEITLDIRLFYGHGGRQGRTEKGDGRRLSSSTDPKPGKVKKRKQFSRSLKRMMGYSSKRQST